jgi:hypothetical protein
MEKKMDTLIEKINILIKINSLSLLEGKTVTQKVELLSSIGLTPKEISEITGADASVISVLKSRAKSKKKVSAEEPKKEE